MIFKNKKAILIIHGFAGGTYDYGDLINDLQLIDDFNVFTFTLPGHNKLIINDVTEKDWIKEAEKQIEKIINNGYKEIYVIGHSMGGVIATHLASKYKEVKKLVLAAPAFRYFKFKNTKLEFKDGIKTIKYFFKRYKFNEGLSRAFKVPLKTLKEFTKLVDKHQDDIKKVNIPILVLHGTKDDIVPIEAIDYVFDNAKSDSISCYEINRLTHELFINNRYNDVYNLIAHFLINKNKNGKTRETIK